MTIPNINFPNHLPVSQRVEDIKYQINKNQVTIICGETGSGKTTQLPKICLSLGRGQKKIIGHTQPRRIAARSVANRISEELETKVGDLVGFKVRFTDKTSSVSSIKVMTDGILLAETQNDTLLKQYDTLIIDEAHERSLNIDFLIGYLKNILPKRPDLKIIITSATIDVDKFSSHFNNAPIVKVSGRTFPVEILYRPLQKRIDETIEDIEDGVLSAIQSLENQKGDILVFLPGERDIHDTKRFLVEQLDNQYEILPLYSRLAIKEQQKIFQTGTLKRIILTTNIAETSLTVPGIKFVIDSGLARIIRYSPRLKIEQLLIEKISQASSNQRAGRCGRISAGTCIRLYEEDDFQARSEFTDPEIMRSSLASVILKMASLNLGPVDQFPFLQPPIHKFIQDGYQLLNELGAVDNKNKILPLGMQLAQMPIDPSLGRILIESKKQNCVKEILVIISALSISDPKERPFDKADKADQAHLLFHDTDSGFLSFIKLWILFKKEVKNLKSKSLRIFCDKYFLSFNRVREWQELYKQLLQMTDELGFKLSKDESSYEQIHFALLSGLLGNIGFKESDSIEYLGARGIKFLVGPRLFRNKKFKWIMAAEIIDTGKLYAQCIAKIDIKWIEKLSFHLLDFEYSNPRWNKKLSRVDANRKSLLYGLIINPKKTIHYGVIKPIESREIFIRQALVEMEYETDAPFWQHNLDLIEQIEKLEHKSRRQDILISKDVLYQFYENKISAEIINGAGFEFWRKKVEKKDSKYLFLTKEYLMQKNADQIDSTQYPETLKINNIPVRLNYRFDPSHPNDGLTVAFSYSALGQMKKEPLEWLVPGMIREKVSTLIKALPKSIRTQLGPVQQVVTEFLSEADFKVSFNDALTDYIRSKTKTSYRVEEKLVNALPEHLKINYQILDEKGYEIDSSKDLISLQQANKERVSEVIEEVAFDIEEDNLTYWPDFEIPEIVEKVWYKETVRGFPALISSNKSINLRVLDNAEDAKNHHYEGVKDLIQLQMKDRMKDLKNSPPQFNNFALKLQTHIEPDKLKKNFFNVVLDESMAWGKPMPRTQKSFDELVSFTKNKIGKVILDYSNNLIEVANLYQELSLLVNKANFLPKSVVEDVEEQLEILLPPYEEPLFLFQQFKNYPRFLSAIKIRIEKYNQRQTKDKDLFSDINRLQTKWIEKVSEFVESDCKIPKTYIDFQWAMQELRVSLFAQELKTPYPISIKRLEKNWTELVNK
ncbi:ATP-dependent RNA helicase HrpA [Nitrosomonadales bacterium]|nr:ATP-dependent RNA helicase HrpA [Nitrosomonadales bacterium]